MMLERWLQIHLLALCILGSLFVAISTDYYLMPIAVFVVGVTSILLTDVWKCFYLHRVIANIVAVAAVTFSLYNFFGGYLNAQLKAIANLLVYLQLILFFQDKNDRIYWHMILLSLLQVVVGAALDLGMVFGVLLGIYTFLSLTALILFFLHRESQASLHVGRGLSSILQPTLWQGTGPILGAANTEDALTNRSLSILGMRNALFIALGAILFSMVYFRTSPRHPEAKWALFQGQRQTQTGFSNELQLQQMGKMLQNNEPVMRVWLLNAKQEPLSRFEPYFAGEVLPVYDPHEAKWKISQVRQNDIEEIDRPGEPLPAAPSGAFTQRIHMRGTNQRSLFAVAPIYSSKEPTADNMRLDKNSHLLIRKMPGDSYFFPETKFTLATTGLVSNNQPAITPAYEPRGQIERFRWAMQLEEASFNFDPDRFAGLSTVAQEWLETKLIDTNNPYAVAKSLEDHFHTPGLYRYSLDMNVARDDRLDPIEEFVTHHRVGHCQYFASALVMMLRSRGIPARMVVGYRGFEYNESFHYYQVQQRHAHAWVEAYLSPEQIPENEPTGGIITPAGAWLRLEPTPTSEEFAAEFARNWLGTARDWIDYFDFVWSDYVVGMNQTKQSTLNQNWLTATEDQTTTRSWKEQSKRWAAWLGIHFNEGNFGIRFDWRASITAMVLATFCLLGVQLGRKWLRYWSWNQTWNWRRKGRNQPSVPMYVRLEKLLSREGFQRPATQTPREYAAHCALLVDDSSRQAIDRIVETYYSIRFGNHRPDAHEQQEIEGLLAQLESTYLKPEAGT
jgi:protein-glutamine gamma-glutamyltransferase